MSSSFFNKPKKIIRENQQTLSKFCAKPLLVIVVWLIIGILRFSGFDIPNNGKFASKNIVISHRFLAAVCDAFTYKLLGISFIFYVYPRVNYTAHTASGKINLIKSFISDT